MESLSDRELLEFAAKAAGISFFVDSRGREMQMHGGLMPAPWNPLTDDGDALRLAVKLRIWVEFPEHEPDMPYARAVRERHIHALEDFEDHSSPLAATRRAIVRAAASIGAATQ